MINVKDYPLTKLSSMTASETSKVLENSYRAVNIALMEEWGRFAEAIGLDLFEIVEASPGANENLDVIQPTQAENACNMG